MIGLIALGLVASGCTADSDVEAERPSATTSDGGGAESSPPPAIDVSAFRAELEASFGGSGNESSWYSHIIGMEATGSRLDIATDLDPESGIPTAMQLCGSVMGFALASHAGEGIESVAVSGSGGTPIGGCA
ncbi:hypothetical protein [Agromyces sp. M3QZ16-3]|uniref:hypothetical protein n=1 Tax=Agromyces sp. M3QZ16-3 TaxID=3447585 RepID=UPI003F68EFA9